MPTQQPSIMNSGLTQAWVATGSEAHQKKERGGIQSQRFSRNQCRGERGKGEKKEGRTKELRPVPPRTPHQLLHPTRMKSGVGGHVVNPPVDGRPDVALCWVFVGG